MSLKRKALSKKTRFEVFKRDSFTCQYCGATPPGVILHIDHIKPVVDGGSNDIDNLFTACEPCNLGKGATPLSSIPKTLKDKAAEVSEREDQIKGYNDVLMARSARIENESWNVATALEQTEWLESYNRQRLQSIKTFLTRLPFAEVKDAAEVAAAKFRRMSDQGFKYFCGICWSKIREAQGGTR